MSDFPRHLFSDDIIRVFEQLQPDEVAQFYQGYQVWKRQQAQLALQQQITQLRHQLTENARQLHAVQPSAMALATLARLQSSGVEDITLLDTMLERGDTWLDKTMMRLEYCERWDFIRGNYTDWCELALEGAYDWIDPVLESTPSSEVVILTEEPDEFSEVSEERILQRLMSEDEEHDLVEATLKTPAVSPIPVVSEESPVLDEEAEEISTLSPAPVVSEEPPLPSASEELAEIPAFAEEFTLILVQNEIEDETLVEDEADLIPVLEEEPYTVEVEEPTLIEEQIPISTEIVDMFIEPDPSLFNQEEILILTEEQPPEPLPVQESEIEPEPQGQEEHTESESIVEETVIAEAEIEHEPLLASTVPVTEAEDTQLQTIQAEEVTFTETVVVEQETEAPVYKPQPKRSFWQRLFAPRRRLSS